MTPAAKAKNSEQWAATAKLRRLEVERLEALMGETERE
jgi:hypothetical protein